MSSEFQNTTVGGYDLREASSKEPWHPVDPPDNTGGGLGGDPVKPDYVYPPTSVDPQEPEPPSPTPPKQA